MNNELISLIPTNVVFNRFEDAPLNIEIATYLQDYDLLLKMNVFIALIIVNDPVKVSNFKYIFKAQDRVLRSILNSMIKINKENSIIFTIIDFKEGIKFVVDSNFYLEGIRRRNKISEINLGGVLILLEHTSNRIIKFSRDVRKMVAPNENLILVNSFKEAFILIERFKKATYKNNLYLKKQFVLPQT